MHAKRPYQSLQPNEVDTYRKKRRKESKEHLEDNFLVVDKPKL